MPNDTIERLKNLAETWKEKAVFHEQQAQYSRYANRKEDEQYHSATRITLLSCAQDVLNLFK